MSSEGQYQDVLPCEVSELHHWKEYPAQMLRLLGQRRNRKTMSSSDGARLDTWLAKLESDGMVVGYCPNSVHGFYYVPKNMQGEEIPGIPIRSRPLRHVDL